MSDNPVLKLFVHPAGNYIAAQEIERKGGTRIKVKYPAFARQNPNAVGFSFEPFQFVVDEFTLYTNSLLGEVDMPALMQPFYVKYITEREAESKRMP